MTTYTNKQIKDEALRIAGYDAEKETQQVFFTRLELETAPHISTETARLQADVARAQAALDAQPKTVKAILVAQALESLTNQEKEATILANKGVEI